MMFTRHDLFQRLADLGIETVTVEHEPVFSVGESDELYKRIPGGHTKNLFLKDARDDLYLVIAYHETRVDLKMLARVIGSARLSFGRPELLEATLGVTPGSVTAFALASDNAGRVRAIFDKRLMNFGIVNLHPLQNSATTSIAREDLLRFIRATGHDPVIVALSGE